MYLYVTKLHKPRLHAGMQEPLMKHLESPKNHMFNSLTLNSKKILKKYTTYFLEEDFIELKILHRSIKKLKKTF